MAARPQRAALVGLIAAFVPFARAQDMDSYEMRYGRTVEVSIDQLLMMPESYDGKAVKTRGTLETTMRMSDDLLALRGTMGARVYIQPMPEARQAWSDLRRWFGSEVEVTGVVGMFSDPETGQRAVIIGVWGFLGPPEKDPSGRPPSGVSVNLESLVTRPGSMDGKTVTVVGRFRGSNLFGDLPAASQRGSSDWVIKDDVFAAWVTGKKPKGSGWTLDTKLRRDTGKWLRVTGRVSTVRGVVYVQAVDVALTSPPATAAAEAAPAPEPPSPPRPKASPVVVFSLPLDGERDVPPDSVFRVQFSKDMDEASFAGRVVLRYAGRPQPGDRGFDGARTSYDLGRRALTIDPGDQLRPGRVVEVLLLEGIVDIDGLSLQTRPGHTPGGAVDVLRFQVAPGLLSGPPF